MYWMMTSRAPIGELIALAGDQPNLLEPGTNFSLSWHRGHRFTAPLPEPLSIALNDLQGGDYVPDYFQPAIPLMRDRLLTVLRKAGVDNIDDYAVTLKSRKVPAAQLEGFRAVNIIGMLKCADLEASTCEIDDADAPGGVTFDSLVIDDSRAAGAMFFRLYEAPNGLVVIDSVKKAVEAAQLPGVVFVKPEDWLG